MRRTAGMLVGLILLSTGLSAVAAEATVYPTESDCWEATHTSCVATEKGWEPGQTGGGTGQESVIEDLDPITADRMARSARPNWSGTPTNPIVMVDMDKVEFPDALPYLDPTVNRVRVPLRFVAEAMGAKVEWEPTTRQVTLTRESMVIRLTIDQPDVLVNGKAMQVDAAPIIYQDRTMVPLRFISEVLGAQVDWVGTETPEPSLPEWGDYQVWIWIPWGFWGSTNLNERLHVHSDWFYREGVH